MDPKTIKLWLKANRKDRAWLANQCGVHKQTVDGWLSANRTISAPAAQIIKGLMQGSAALNPRLTLEEYNRAQAIATSKGKSLEDWISELIKGAIKLLICGGLVWLLVSCAQANVLEPGTFTVREEVRQWQPGLTEEQRNMLDWWAAKLAADDELDHIFKAISRKAGWQP